MDIEALGPRLDDIENPQFLGQSGDDALQNDHPIDIEIDPNGESKFPQTIEMTALQTGQDTLGYNGSQVSYDANPWLRTGDESNVPLGGMGNAKRASKLREGKYRLGVDHTALARPYVVVPSSLLLNPAFSFDEVFLALQLRVPAVIFRLNRAKDPSHWNFRLPQSRKKLRDIYASNKPSRSSTARMTKESNDGIPLASFYHSIDLAATFMETKETNNMADESKAETVLTAKRGVNVLKQHATKGNKSGKNSTPDPNEDASNSIIHYYGVLRENCRRLLRGTYTACEQAGAIFRIYELWTDDFSHDVVAEWISGTGEATLLGIADCADLNKDVWMQLDSTAKVRENDPEGSGKYEESEVFIDPTPYFRGEKKLSVDPVTNRKYNSIPHPRLTHLIISDNIPLLEQKLQECAPWGLILVNGGRTAAASMVDAIQNGRPLICIKYTGGAADLACEMLERVDFFLEERKRNPLELPAKPFDDDKKSGYSLPHWLRPFDDDEIKICQMMNILIENWPDRFNPASVFIVDMFLTTEDEVQDRITQTMGVVFEAAHELGGSVSEHRRLTYAWRMRHKFIYNATNFKVQSDILMILITLFTMLSTISAVLYTHFQINPNLLGSYNDFMLWVLLKSNLLLPLVATIIRGIYSSLSPMLKYVALKNASIQVETEIYMYRTKVGKYSMRKRAFLEDKDSKDKKTDSDDLLKLQNEKVNPSKLFSSALDRIWLELAASDIQNGSLKTPMDTSKPLTDINKRIRSNRREQDAYLTPLQRFNADKDTNRLSAHADSEGDANNKEKIMKKRKNFSAFLYKCFCCLCQLGKFAKVATEAIFVSSIPKDDGLSPLSADEYVKIRLLPMAAHYSKRSPILSTSIHSAAIFGVILSVASSALSTFGLSVFIPAALALSGAITAWLNYEQIELRLLQTNAALNQLNQLLVWWDGLTMIEKRVPNHKETLVRVTEHTIQSQATIFSGGSSSKRSDDDKSKGGEEDGNK